MENKIKSEDLETFLEEKESEYLKDDAPQGFLRGLQILSKYYPNIRPSAQHDIIYCTDIPEEMDKEDVIALNRLGFHLDEDSWSKFT